VFSSRLEPGWSGKTAVATPGAFRWLHAYPSPWLVAVFPVKKGVNTVDHLIKPYGGKLQNLVVDEARAAQLKKDSQGFPAVTLTQRQLCDLELLMNGAFSPLRGFMSREAYESVLDKMRLPDGLLWSMPIALDVPDAVAEKLEPAAGSD
jgi:hypothetical protein